MSGSNCDRSLGYKRMRRVAWLELLPLNLLQRLPYGASYFAVLSFHGFFQGGNGDVRLRADLGEGLGNADTEAGVLVGKGGGEGRSRFFRGRTQAGQRLGSLVADGEFLIL